jgi:cbb3-type cytochrome oxidase subunit 3
VGDVVVLVMMMVMVLCSICGTLHAKNKKLKAADD